MDFKVKNLTSTWFVLNGEIFHSGAEMIITGRDAYLSGLGDELLRLKREGAISLEHVEELPVIAVDPEPPEEESVNPNTGVKP